MTKAFSNFHFKQFLSFRRDCTIAGNGGLFDLKGVNVFIRDADKATASSWKSKILPALIHDYSSSWVYNYNEKEF